MLVRTWLASSYPLFGTHFAARRLTRLGSAPLLPSSMPWADWLPAPVQAAVGCRNRPRVCRQCWLSLALGAAGWYLPPCSPPWAVWQPAPVQSALGCRQRPRVCRQCSQTLPLVGSRGGAVLTFDPAGLLGFDGHSTFFVFQCWSLDLHTVSSSVSQHLRVAGA